MKPKKITTLFKKCIKKYGYPHMLKVVNKATFKTFSIRTLYGWNDGYPIGRRTASQLVPVLQKMLGEK